MKMLDAAQPLAHREKIGAGRALQTLLLFVLCCVICASTLAFGQNLTTGDIAGTVTDLQGAVVPRVQVTAVNQDTKAELKTESTGNGAYRLPFLAPGRYLVTTSYTGFEVDSVDVLLAAGKVAQANFRLRPGSISQTVNVTEAAPLLDTENGDLSTSFNQEQIQALPNPGSDVTFVAQLAPGSVMNTAGGTGNFSSYGLPAVSNNMTINGASIISPWSNTNNTLAMNITLGNNDLSGATVISNAYSVQYGGLGGAQLIETTRAGTDRFHGNIGWWWNNQSLNANTYFNAQQNIPEAKQDAYQWAAAIGGPIAKGKTFFFVNFEGTRFTTATSPTLVYLPSQAFESRTLASIAQSNPSELDLYKQIFSVYDATPIPKGQTLQPYNNVNTFTGTTSQNLDVNKFTFEPTITAHEYLATARVDHNFSANDKIYFHYEWDDGIQPAYEDPINPAFNVMSSMGGSNGTLSETHTFSAKAVNVFLFAGTYTTAGLPYPSGANAVFPYQFNFSDLQVNQNNTVLHYSDPLTALNPNSADWPQGTNEFQYQFIDDFSLVKGSHIIKAGGLFLRTNAVDLSPDAGVVPRVSAYGDGYGEQYAQATGTGNYFALFDQGYASSTSGNFPLHSEAPFSFYQLGGYLQDEWQVKPNLTLNAGLRVERNSNPASTNNFASRLKTDFLDIPNSPDTPYNSVIAGAQRDVFTSYQPYIVEPRASFAWQPAANGQTVVRGGVGMFADSFPVNIANGVLYNAPGKTTFTVNSQSLSVPGPQYLFDPALQGSGYQGDVISNNVFQAQYYNGGTYASISKAVADAGSAFAIPGYFTPSKHISYPSYVEWNLQVQNQLGNHTVLSLSYNGNHGYHEPYSNSGLNEWWNPNLLPNPGVLVNTQSGNMFHFQPQGVPLSAPNQNFAGIDQIQSGAISNYNGLTADLTHRDKYLILDINYSWSKAMDEMSNGGIFGFNSINSYYPSPESPYDLHYNYGPSDYNVTNNVKASYVLNVPRFGGIKRAIGDWQIAGDIFWHTGFPFSVVDSFALNGFGAMASANSAYPYNGGSGAVTAVPINGGMDRHCGTSGILNFNTNSGGNCFGGISAFTDPSGFGSEDKNQYTAPGYFDTDLDILKSFPLPKWEGAKFQAGAQFFNILNHPNFGYPTNDIGAGAGFGQISSTVSPPTSIYGAYLGGNASGRIIQIKATLVF